MAKKTTSASKKAYYGRYQNDGTWTKNKRAKIERHLKKYPNDTQAKAALKEIGDNRKRSTPKTDMWSPTKRYYAEIFAKVGMNGHLALDNEKLSATLNNG